MSSSAPMVSHGAMHSLHASAAPAFFRACSRSCCERSSVTAAKAPALRNTFLERLLHLLARAGWKPVVTASSCMTMVAVRSRMGCAAGGRGEPSCLRGAPQISRAVLALVFCVGCGWWCCWWWGWGVVGGRGVWPSGGHSGLVLPT